MSHNSPALAAWKKLSGMPGGRWLFSRFVSMKAPYFASIGAQFVELRPGYCELQLKKRRKVLNHIGTMHAIAMCNMAELAAGTMTDVSIPSTHRWIPKGMTVDYLAKAETDLRAVAALDPIPAFAEATEVPVSVNVIDTNGTQVFRAVIRMWISPRGSRADRPA